MIIRFIILLFLTFTSNVIFAQIIDNEQSHPSIKWRQIENEYYQLIFPSALEEAARNLANELSYFIKKNNSYFDIKSKKTPIILQGNHVSQNGFVQLAPRKSELFPIPSATADNQSWLENLAIHEVRHIAQFDKMTGNFNTPFFEQLAFGLYGLNVPAWYFEGDAVLSETINSKGGRGRLPSWEMPLRANLLSEKKYSFDKYALGSYKDNIPSYYTIGYFMNSYITNHFTTNSTNAIFSEMKGKLLRPFNFRRALKHQTGESVTSIYQKLTAELNEKWRIEKPLEDTNSTKIPLPYSPYPSDYLLPQFNKNDIYALYRSPESVNKIVKLSKNKHQELVKTGIQIEPHFDIRGEEIVWDEYRKDSRFGKQTYSVINIYDIKTKKLKTLTKKSRFYAPSLHPILRKIVVVEVTKDLSSKIVILDSETGNVTASIPSIPGTHLQQPRFNDIGSKIIAIAVSDLGTNLVEFDLNTMQFHYLLPWSNQQLERPVYHQTTVIFKAHYNGIDNIYYHTAEGKISRITNSTFGAFNPDVNSEGTLLYNDYQANGFKIAQTQPNKIYNYEGKKYQFYIEPTLIQSTEMESHITDSVLKPQIVTDYSPFKHLVNFHSLSISSTNFESFDNYLPGIFWLSNDVLNTTQMKIGFEYDPELHKSHYTAEISYNKYFPKFTISYANRGMTGNAVTSNDPNKTVMYDYRLNQIAIDVSLPFSLYRQNTVYSFGTNFGTSYTNRYNVNLELKNFQKSIAFPLNYQAYFNRNTMRSKMDLAPKWGQNISVTYRHLPFENTVKGQILSARTNFYFPGAMNNHSLQIRAAFQKGSGRYNGVYDIPMVSGWGYFTSPIVTNTASLTYSMPLLYPDWNIGSIAYIKRLQSFIFSDFQNIQSDLNPKSYGFGISADFNAFRYVLPDINLGLKATFINDRTATKKILPSINVSYSY